MAAYTKLAEIQGSAKDPYVVSRNDATGELSCTCPGWKFRAERSCKHTKAIKAPVAKTPASAPIKVAAVPSDPFKTDAPVANPQAHLRSDVFPVLLADTWDGEKDLTGWIVSEKLDGVRAYWDGEKFISRQGNIFTAPKAFTEGLPKIHLDGELFLGRKRFNEGSGIARSPASDPRWLTLKFVVFDVPNRPGSFADRIAYLNTLKLGKYAEAHKFNVLESMAHVEPLLDLVIEQLHGEGLMARYPASAYERRRSPTLLKLKRFYDMEATVVGYNEGKGWRQGMTGSLKVQTTGTRKFPHFEVPAGVEFDVGCQDKKMCLTPPALGTVITFKFQEVSPKDSIPRFPIFLRVRLPE